MFTILVILAYCCSIIGSSSVDRNSNEKYIDGSQHTINSVGITFTQHVSNHGKCSVEVNEESKILSEGEIIKIKNKWFKVEDCRLNRAYAVSCGSKLYYQLRDLACSFVEESYDKKMRIRRQTKDALIQLLDKPYHNPCCESACTITELLHYCPTK